MHSENVKTIKSQALFPSPTRAISSARLFVIGARAGPSLVFEHYSWGAIGHYILGWFVASLVANSPYMRSVGQWVGGQVGPSVGL